jgi:hypothetical protein
MYDEVQRLLGVEDVVPSKMGPPPDGVQGQGKVT